MPNFTVDVPFMAVATFRVENATNADEARRLALDEMRNKGIDVVVPFMAVPREPTTVKETP